MELICQDSTGMNNSGKILFFIDELLSSIYNLSLKLTRTSIKTHSEYPNLSIFSLVSS